MCGIVGVINRSAPVDTLVVRKMTQVLQHRGPDGIGYFTENNVGLGHTRLSIIDEEGGKQPFFSPDGRFVLIYNGECYNFRELRGELEKLGQCFLTRSDTEVVLRAFIEWGTDAFLKFNGMFSLAVYDRAQQRVTIARDRFGVKPLYYLSTARHFVFSSEIKSILNHPQVRAQLNHEALNEYFSFQNIFSDTTLFSGVRKLEHGTFLQLDLRSFEQTFCRYWDYSFGVEQWEHSEDETSEILMQTFIRAVERQMVSDVPLGAYLSGGIDSGSITSVIASRIPDLSTFTCGFELSRASGLELDFDERARAELVSARYKTRHYEVILNSDDLKTCLDRVIFSLDEPLLGMSYPNYFIAELASKFVKVTFSGAGGDELFGGYPWRYFRSTTLGPGEEQYYQSYYDYWQRLVSDQEKKQLFVDSVANKIDIGAPYEAFKRVFSGFSGDLASSEDYVNKSLYFEAKTFLQGLFYIEDKLTMTHSLESRVPFMDNELVDLAMKIPPRFKIRNLDKLIRFDENQTAKRRNYFLESNDGKNILRSALRGFLPEEISSANKQGFSSPEASWSRGERAKFISDELLDANSPILEVVERSFIRKKVELHQQGKENNRLLIWSMLSLNSFMRQFITADVENESVTELRVGNL